MRNRKITIRLGLGALAALLALWLVPAAGASTVEADGSSIDIEGDTNADVITVSTNGTIVTVVDTGTGGVTTADVDCNQVNAQTVTCPIAIPNGPLRRFEVNLSNGTDSFTNQNWVTEDGHIHSNDPVSGPASGVKTIVGGPGSQQIDGGLNSDSLSGGDGDDFLTDGGTGEGGVSPTGGNDIVDGGAGADTYAAFRDGTAPVSLTFDGVANDGYAGETDNLLNIENASGGAGNDTLIGSAAANALEGGPGDDVINGMGGNDDLAGEFGTGGAVLIRGIVFGFSANDTLIGGTGRDGLDCGTGNDVAVRDPSDDVSANCERIGAEVRGDSAGLSGKKKNRFKIAVECPESEGVACVGKLAVTSNDKKIGKGKFNIAPGETKQVKSKLKKKGTKAVKKAGGSLLVSIDALTTEPGGESESTGSVLIFR